MLCQCLRLWPCNGLQRSVGREEGIHPLGASALLRVSRLCSKMPAATLTFRESISDGDAAAGGIRRKCEHSRCTRVRSPASAAPHSRGATEHNVVQPSKTWCNTAHAHCREFAAVQVGAMSPVPVQMWDGTHRSTRRRGLERLAGFAGERTVCSPPIAPPVKRRMQQHDAMNSMMLCNMQHPRVVRKRRRTKVSPTPNVRPCACMPISTTA